jgi:hypothetical protein
MNTGVHARVAAAAIAAGLAGVVGCSDTTGPSQAAPPYLAIISKVDAAPGTPVGAKYAYRVRSLSAGLALDTTVQAAPTDTVILSLRPATYAVEIGDVPPSCLVRDGAEQEALIPPKSNTTVVRYQVLCRNVATVVIRSDSAFALDTAKRADYVYRLTRPDGTVRLGLAHPIDTLRFDGLGSGTARFELLDVGENCQVVSDGGPSRRFPVDSVGGARIDLAVSCAALAGRPSVAVARASYHDGTLGFLIKAVDPDFGPDSTVDRYSVDVTDCQRNSLLPSGVRTVGGLSEGRANGRDTLVVLGGFEPGLPEAKAQAGCFLVAFTDLQGNTSLIVEQPLGAGSPGPRVDAFNARFSGPTLLQTLLAVSDPTYLGTFWTGRLRDGSNGQITGAPIVVWKNRTGIIGTTAMPDIQLGSPPILFENFIAVVLYVFDVNGNFTRVEDDDLFN